MDIYNFMNQKYEEYLKTGKSSIKFPELNVKNKSETKPEFYSCGHSIKVIIINTTKESLASYFEWKESKSNLCIKCWLLKERNK